MRRNVVIADASSSPTARRLQSLFSTALEGAAGGGDGASIAAIEKPDALVAALSGGSVDILVVPLDFDREGLDAVGWVAGAVPPDGSVQVIYAAVNECPSSRVYLTDHAYLLPREANLGDVRTGLACATKRLRKWGERPFLLHARGGERLIVPRRVSYVESDRRIVCVHEPGEVIEAYGKLSDVRRLLPDRFVQCHKSFLVNMGFVDKVDKESILLTTGDRVPVSQRRRAQTRASLHEFVGRSL